MQEQREEAHVSQPRRGLRCPTCADRLVQVAAHISHPHTGKIIHLYRCDCGERIWDE